MAHKAKQVAAAVSETVAQVTPMRYVAFNGSLKQPKTVIAREASELQNELYLEGYALGNDAGDIEQRCIDLLARCRTPFDRIVLRHGYVDGYISAQRVIKKRIVWPTPEQADQRFSALARVYSPDTSRKAKSNAKKKPKGKPGRKETTGAKVTSVSAREGRMELALNELLVDIKATQESAVGDELEQLAAWASKIRKALRK